jgi:hypothetical protein
MKSFNKKIVVSASIFLLSFVFLGYLPAASSASTAPAFVPAPNIGLYHCSKTSSCPMGISDYGVNGLKKYNYYATVFESWANFTKLSIASPGSISIQQNIVSANTTSGKTVGEYWPQNVPFVTQSGTKYIINEIDNIWNFSYSNICPNYPSNNDGCMVNIAGNLLGKCSSFGGAPTFYYCQSAQQITTTLPFEIRMNTTIFVLNSGAYKGHTAVEFGIWVYHSGKLLKGEWYDLVAFSGKARTEPVIRVGGMNPLGLYNDAETVLCGPGGGSSATITDISAKLWEGYIAPHSTHLKQIPHAWSAGTDTAETVYGVHMTAPTKGIGTAAHGADNNQQLW